MFWFWFENVKWKIETKTKIHTLRLESNTVPIVLLIYYFESLWIFIFSYHLKGKRMPIAKFRLGGRECLNRLGYFLKSQSAVPNTLQYIFYHLFLEGWKKNKIYVWVLNISFQASLWTSLWIELLGSNTNITADHTAIVL